MKGVAMVKPEKARVSMGTFRGIGWFVLVWGIYLALACFFVHDIDNDKDPTIFAWG